MLHTELNLWRTRIIKHASEEIHPAFEEQHRRRKVKKSKTVVSMVPQIRLMSYQRFKRNKTGNNFHRNHVFYRGRLENLDIYANAF